MGSNLNLEEKKNMLLEKVANRSITSDEVIELSEILEEESATREMNEGVRTLIMLGLGALGGYLLTRASMQDKIICHGR
ncbi:MAG: hypothetical protein QME49_05305 [bacterium]|nr:hypothetical protein [bacterium]